MEAQLAQFGQPPVVEYSLPHAFFRPPLQTGVSRWEADDSEWGGEWVHAGMRRRPLTLEPPPYIRVQSNCEARNSQRNLQEALFGFSLVLYCADF